jgi:hypothetical protein
MALFAKLNSENIVITVESVVNEVITDSNGIEQEQLGIDFLNQLYNTNDNWKQTSYNTHGNVHSLGGIPFRKNHAGIGYTYDSQRDAFISPKPYTSWVLNEITCLWESPVAMPTTELEENQYYSWNESIINWEVKARQ